MNISPHKHPMIWVITILGIPVARAHSLGQMGRKLKRISKLLKNHGVAKCFPPERRVQLPEGLDCKEIRVFVLDGDRWVDTILYVV